MNQLQIYNAFRRAHSCVHCTVLSGALFELRNAYIITVHKQISDFYGIKSL